ncbi:TonB-dependent receptor [Stenotrophomonas mori]|uniref:TonB-dependent receptor n=1 Tax=Stenotrophomonas mori TaxID=2871096 RepID=A0ABT0SHN1_9GAMM|nr:TonB-dependent receptor [Stenotrophomonas mori]MCL7714839.1 TonB-dependent receptor [Stenotrophomonas mori]
MFQQCRRPARTAHARTLLFLSCCLALGAGMAQPASAQAVAGSAAPADGKSRDAVTLDHVVVTASKRVGQLKDVAGGISAVSQEELEAVGAQSNADYLGRQPGVVFNVGTPGQSTAVIRGVGTTAGIDQGQGPTGWYIDDVPLSEPSYAVGIPDIDTFDLQRVEVLRGPQGTLFGASSLGGAINYITNRADPGGFDAAVEAGINNTYNAHGELGYTAKAMVNLPVSETLALRIVGLTRMDAGYLDNTGTGDKGSTDVSVNGGRASLVWQPSDATTLSLMGMYQVLKGDDQNYAHSAQGKYARNSLLLARTDYDISLFTARLEHAFDGADLTAIVSRDKKTHELHSDVSRTSALRPFLPVDTPIDATEYMDIDMRTAEVRLASPADGRWEWLVGGMYTTADRDTRTFTSAEGAYGILSKVRPEAEYDGTDNVVRGYSVAEGRESALFGEIGLNFSDAWNLTVGGRLFKSRYDIRIDRYGFIYVPSQHPDPYRIDEDGFVPKMSLRYRPSADTTWYAVASKGFRLGNPNTIYPCACDFVTPDGWGSDKLWNYELGLRSSFLDRRLALDAGVFYIDWKDIQVRLVRPDNATYGTNAGKARIYGLESSLSFDVTPNVNWRTNLTLLKAELTEDVLTASPVLRRGQQLPGASDVQLSNTLTWYFDTAWQPSLVFQHRYLSEAPQTLSDPVATVAGFNQFDLRLNLRRGNIGYSIWGTNLTNEHVPLSGYGTSTLALYGRSEFLLRPRTLGVTVSWKY